MKKLSTGAILAIGAVVTLVVAYLAMVLAAPGATEPEPGPAPVTERQDETPAEESTDEPADEWADWTFPECDAVWIAGERLPEDYGGCESRPDFVEVAIIDGSGFVEYNGLRAQLGGVIE